MKTRDQGKLTPYDQTTVQDILNGITALAQFLEKNSVPVDPSPEDLYIYLTKMKQIQRNASIAVSRVSCVLAKKYLDAHLEMKPFNATEKNPSAKGLDIDECTVADERVIGEIKATAPCGAKGLGGQRDLGGEQKAKFEDDFHKLHTIPAKHRFFFVTERDTFTLMKRPKYTQQMPGVRVVLLPGGDETFTA